MIENKIIFKDKKASIGDGNLGISGENEQERLIFLFEDEFVDGTCFLELEFPNGQKNAIELEKDETNKSYSLTVKNSLLRYVGTIDMQLKIIQKTAVWKSKTFKMVVENAINAVESIEDEYLDFGSWVKIRMQELEEAIEQFKNNSDSNEGKDFTETDPTVPAWAKEPTKPNYTAGEVGALPNNTKLFSGDYNDLRNKPSEVTKLSQLQNDSGFITNAELPIKEMAEVEVSIFPNVYYIWEEVEELTITLVEEENRGRIKEYCFEFKSGETPTMLIMDDNIKWVSEPNVEANKTYQVSILNGVGVIIGV